jgi:hypothetical protein
MFALFTQSSKMARMVPILLRAGYSVRTNISPFFNDSHQLNQFLRANPRIQYSVEHEKIPVDSLMHNSEDDLLLWNDRSYQQNFTSFQQFLFLSCEEKKKLQEILWLSKYVHEAILKKYVSIEQLLQYFNKSTACILFNKRFIHHLLDSGIIILNDWLPHKLDYLLSVALLMHSENRSTIDDVLKKDMTVDDILLLNPTELKDLNFLMNSFWNNHLKLIGNLNEFSKATSDDKEAYGCILSGIDCHLSLSSYYANNEMIPTLTFRAFMSLGSDVREKIKNSHISLWMNDFTIDQFLSFSQEDRSSLACILFTNMGIIALSKKQITIQQFLDIPLAKRNALSYILRQVDPIYNGERIAAESNDQIFESELFDLNEFVDLPESERYDYLTRVEEGGIRPKR